MKNQSFLVVYGRLYFLVACWCFFLRESLLTTRHCKWAFARELNGIIAWSICMCRHVEITAFVPCSLIFPGSQIDMFMLHVLIVQKGPRNVQDSLKRCDIGCCFDLQDANKKHSNKEPTSQSQPSTWDQSAGGFGTVRSLRPTRRCSQT